MWRLGLTLSDLEVMSSFVLSWSHPDWLLDRDGTWTQFDTIARPTTTSQALEKGRGRPFVGVWRDDLRHTDTPLVRHSQQLATPLVWVGEIKPHLSRDEKVQTSMTVFSC